MVDVPLQNVALLQKINNNYANVVSFVDMLQFGRYEAPGIPFSLQHFSVVACLTIFFAIHYDRIDLRSIFGNLRNLTAIMAFLIKALINTSLRLFSLQTSLK